MDLREIVIGNITIPTDFERETFGLTISTGVFPIYSSMEDIGGKVPKTSLAHRILLIGSSAHGLMDVRFSPLGGVIPGIEIHAQVLEQILSGARLNRPSWVSLD